MAESLDDREGRVDALEEFSAGEIEVELDLLVSLLLPLRCRREEVTGEWSLDGEGVFSIVARHPEA